SAVKTLSQLNVVVALANQVKKVAAIELNNQQKIELGAMTPDQAVVFLNNLFAANTLASEAKLIDGILKVSAKEVTTGNTKGTRPVIDKLNDLTTSLPTQAADPKAVETRLTEILGTDLAALVLAKANTPTGVFVKEDHDVAKAEGGLAALNKLVASARTAIDSGAASAAAAAELSAVEADATSVK
ncbi:MAG: hypothetical protein WC838_04690, partial [Candidatus Margulisiibacteriota bacterium]